MRTHTALSTYWTSTVLPSIRSPRALREPLPNAWAFSGGVDAVESDLYLAVLAVEAGERVAVGDQDDLELLGKRLDSYNGYAHPKALPAERQQPQCLSAIWSVGC